MQHQAMKAIQTKQCCITQWLVTVVCRDYVQRQGPWEKGVPSGLKPGVAKLIKALLCMAFHLRMTTGFSAATLESQWYYSQPLVSR